MDNDIHVNEAVEAALVRALERVAELEANNQVLLESQGQFRSDLQAARVEGLRRAKDLCQPCVHAIQCIMAIDAEIAALERGKN